MILFSRNHETSPFSLQKNLHFTIVLSIKAFCFKPNCRLRDAAVWLLIGNICIRYTHKMSGFKTSGFKTSGFKTSETSGLQNVRFTKRQVYKMSGLQNVRSSKRPVAKKHPYIFCTCGWWKSTGFVSAFCLWMSQPVVMDVSACRISDF